MRRTALNVGLTLWLIVSLGFWLSGVAFSGELYLPSLNPFTVSVLYAPWLVLLAIGFKAATIEKEDG